MEDGKGGCGVIGLPLLGGTGRMRAAKFVFNSASVGPRADVDLAGMKLKIASKSALAQKMTARTTRFFLFMMVSTP
jgi:hypothetical protein